MFANLNRTTSAVASVIGASVIGALVLGTSVIGTTAPAYAAPWDADMFSQESLQANEVARAPAKGTVPLGKKPFILTADEADKQLTNTIAPDLDSAWRGRRLYNANCVTCHGRKGDGKGPVGASLPVPNFHEDFYKNRSDGRFFAVIHNGGAVMPRYGYKFSESEHWDIVNYVRFLQGIHQVPGLPQPK